MRFFISNYHFYRTDCHPGRAGRTAVAVRKCVHHNYVDLPQLVSVEATGVCIPIGNNEVLLASVYNSPARAWSDAHITELLSFRRKSILAGGLGAKHPFWNSAVSNPSGEKLMALFNLSEFEISAHQCPTHYSPAGNGDVLDIAVHPNIRVLDVIALIFRTQITDQLYSTHWIMSKLGIFWNLLKNSQIGISFKASPRN
jgi:hypothetical protein